MLIFPTLVIIIFSHKQIVSSHDVAKFIQSQGYPAEIHFAQTKSGYVLGLHRIPNGKFKNNGNGFKPVVLLLHGFAESSACWVLSGKKSALGFQLADKGYDVWLANSRGSPYSFNHTKLNLTNHKDFQRFISYSFYEQGVEDLPTTIEYVLNYTKKLNLSLYAHSEGAAVFYTMGAKVPKILGKINAFFAFAPMVFIGNTTSTMIELFSTAEYFYLGHFVYKYLQNIVHIILPIVQMFSSFTSTKSLSIFPLSIICGSAKGQIDKETISRLYKYFPTFVSEKQLRHLLQLVKSNEFQEYENEFPSMKRIIFGATKIHLKDNPVPTYLYFSQNDLFINPANMKKYKMAFVREPKMFNVHNGFGHYDFVYGVDAHKVYNLTYGMLAEHSGLMK